MQPHRWFVGEFQYEEVAAETIQFPNIAFNAAVMTLANKVCPAGYDVAHDGSAPESLEALQDHIARTGRILVDGRNSDHTIFGCPEHNWAFRAWHDWTHYIISAPFTLQGELEVAQRQIADMHRVFGHGEQASLFASLIMSEVYGQALYYDKHGEFPRDQVAFTRQYTSGYPETAVFNRQI